MVIVRTSRSSTESWGWTFLLWGVAHYASTEFTWLRGNTGATGGNLGTQMMKLEEAGYVSVEKRFVQRKPQTLYRLTETGRAALVEYVQALKQLLGAAVGSALD